MATKCAVKIDPICRRLARQLTKSARERGQNVPALRSAIAFGDACYSGILRKTGEPFYSHCLQAALLVQNFGGTEDDIYAALFHDAIEDNKSISAADIELSWGAPVALRVAAVTKDYGIATPEKRLIDAHGKLLQATALMGPGVAAIKLADRAHNSATSRSLAPHKITQIKNENRLLFAPLAHMVGAHGLARFLADEPAAWWQAESHFVERITALQPLFLPTTSLLTQCQAIRLSVTI